MNKQFDNKSSFFGIFLSILTIVIFFYLIFTEYSNYSQPILEKNTMIYNHEKNNKVIVNIDVDMIKAPCSILSFDIEDELLHHRIDIEEIQKIRIDKERKEIGKYVDNKQAKRDAEDDIKLEYGCKLKGTFNINKISGNFHVSYHNYMREYLELLNSDHDFLDKVDLGYKINILEFKSIDEEKNNLSKNMKKKFGLKKDFDFVLDKNIHEFKRMNTFHFLEIIPVVMESDITNQRVVSFINSFHRNFLSHDDNSVPILHFAYKFSAISVHYKEYKNRKVHFIVEVWGTFGGVYCVMHLIKLLYFKINSN